MNVEEGDQVGLVVDKENACLYILDVAAVVVDVLGRSLAISKDVVIITVINDEDTARFDHAAEVLKALDMISLVSMKIRKMSKGVPHANHSIKATRWLLNILFQCEPVGLLNSPVLKILFLPPLPPCPVSNLEHLIRGIRRRKIESFLQQHHRVHTTSTFAFDSTAVILSRSPIRHPYIEQHIEYAARTVG